MGGFSSHNLAFAFGLLGNVISFFVFLSPLPTFYKIYKKKSTEGFQSVPYVVALFSAMLLMYYAFLKDSDGILIITINSFGCLVETVYIVVYLFYAPKMTKVYTIKLLSLMTVGFSLIVILTQFLAKGPTCLQIVGWICLVFSVSVFVAPLCILKQVIRTQSIEYMPFSLSLSLTLNAVMWFFYGLLIKDFNVAIPNVLGFIFGIIQMVLYGIYKRKGTKKLALVLEGQKIMATIDAHQMLEKQVIADQVIDVAMLSEMVAVCQETVPLALCAANELDDHTAAELVLAKAN
ncbi:bidirectional sugar transporter N3-like [Rhododendron vialii]|uniref:bidirectional sugar transporter N3-like n=1 Tax=Rhododendron vialii TaxID=182163 RepID=UPI00265F6DED|nr:bidirectional sugar transporter N3-like [Rhododendron vialii]XP_058194262.1 bidirectional sugar transporter N3-like [Rhododendron vialii]